MFSGGFWGAYAGSDDHLTKERDAPPRPIELEFPQYKPPFNPAPLTSQRASAIRETICRTRSLTALNDSDFANLNIKFDYDVSLASLIPTDTFQDRPLLYDDDLQAMLNEISVENRDAFREVLRLPPLEGHTKPKLAYARNFFGTLEEMSRYYDTSYDEYYNTPIAPVEAEDHSREDREDATDRLDNVQTKEVYKGYRISNAESMNPGARIAMTKNLLKMVMHQFHCRDHEPTPFPREKLMVRGIKVQSIQYHFCVAKIPHDIKQARSRVVEGPLMAVHVRDELRFKKKEGLRTPEKTAFVGEKFDLFREIGCMLILATQRLRGSWSPRSDVDQPEKWWITRERWGGGPTRWGQLSCELYEDEDPSASPVERDLREEKRRREKEDEQEGAKDASTPDTSSLSVDDLIAGSGAAGTAVGSSRDVRPRRKKPRGTGENSATQMRDGRRVIYVPPARQRWYQEWTKLRPGVTNADEKIVSRRIGAVDKSSSGFDEVYQLSSCNHHVSLARMKVHPSYLEWLRGRDNMDAPDDDDAEDRIDVLSVQRSVWYDMFDVEARKEFLIELWRLMCWLNRDEVPAAAWEEMEGKRQNG